METDICIGDDTPCKYRKFLHNRPESHYVRITGGYHYENKVHYDFVKRNRWGRYCFTIYPSRKLLRDDQYIYPDGVFADIYEYKISKKPFGVYIRLLESYTLECGSMPSHYVVDGVVYSASSEENADLLEERVKWHKIDSRLKGLLVLCRHMVMIFKSRISKAPRSTVSGIKS